MAHSQQSLLARYGFQDRDREEPLHDLACEFLAQKAQHERLAEACGLFQRGRIHADTGDRQRTYTELRVVNTSARREVPIADGKFTLGFLDVRVSGSIEYDEHQTEKRPTTVWARVAGTTPDEMIGPLQMLTTKSRSPFGAIAIEVKVRVHVADTLRQIQFYCRGGEYSKWVLATPQRLTPEQREPFARNGITVVRLADGFDAWLKEHRSDIGAEPTF